MTVSLQPRLPWLGRRSRTPSSWTGWTTLSSSSTLDRLAVDDLEDDLVDVHRVGVGGGVVELPDLGVADRRVLRDRVASTCARIQQAPVAASPTTCPSNASTAARPSNRSTAPRCRASGRVTGRRRQRRDRRQPQEPRRRRVDPCLERGHDPELHDLPGRRRVGDCRSRSPGSPPPNGSSGPTLREDVAADRHVREVDDQVGPLGEAHQQPVAVDRGEVDRRRQEAALVADLPDLDPRDRR